MAYLCSDTLLQHDCAVCANCPSRLLLLQLLRGVARPRLQHLLLARDVAGPRSRNRKRSSSRTRSQRKRQVLLGLLLLTTQMSRTLVLLTSARQRSRVKVCMRSCAVFAVMLCCPRPSDVTVLLARIQAGQ